MSWNSTPAIVLGAVVFTIFLPAPARADDRQLVEDYLKDRGITGATIRPISDDFVTRTFPNLSFFGVIFRQYPVGRPCPEGLDIKCANVFYVQDGKVDFFATIPDMAFFFTALLPPVPTQETAADAASTWLRFSEELKQDLFYTFSPPEVAFIPRDDSVLVRARATVAAGGDGLIDVLITLGPAGSFFNVLEKGGVRPGIRPICQATKLLDSDPVVRRMAEQDLLVMGRAAKPYLDSIRATANRELQQAIDRIWQRILFEGR